MLACLSAWSIDSWKYDVMSHTIIKASQQRSGGRHQFNKILRTFVPFLISVLDFIYEVWSWVWNPSVEFLCVFSCRKQQFFKCIFGSCKDFALNFMIKLQLIILTKRFSKVVLQMNIYVKEERSMLRRSKWQRLLKLSTSVLINQTQSPPNLLHNSMKLFNSFCPFFFRHC